MKKTLCFAAFLLAAATATGCKEPQAAKASGPAGAKPAGATTPAAPGASAGSPSQAAPGATTQPAAPQSAATPEAPAVKARPTPPSGPAHRR